MPIDREIGLCLERGDVAGIAAVRRRRAAWLVPTLALLLAVAFGFTDWLLALYRPEFVEPGRQALRVLALSASLSMTLALAPTVLKLNGRNHLALAVLMCATVLQLVLLVWLIPRFGATGAAASQAVATFVLYVTLAALNGGRAQAAPADRPSTGP